MTNETPQVSQTEPKPELKLSHFGARLKSAREALGIERKDAANQLRLNETIITMLESDQYPTDLPTMFVRGYLRSYGKLLQIPELEIKKALEPIKPKVEVQETNTASVTSAPSKPKPSRPKLKRPLPITSGNYFMQFFTYLIIFTVIGLVTMWWYTHSSSSTTVADNQLLPDLQKKNHLNQQLAPTSGSITPTMNSDISPSLVVGKQPGAPVVPTNATPPAGNNVKPPLAANPINTAQGSASRPPQAGSSITITNDQVIKSAQPAPKQADKSDEDNNPEPDNSQETE